MWPRSARGGDDLLLTLLLVSLGALAARLAVTEPGTAWYVPLVTMLGYAAATVLLARLSTRVDWFRASNGTPALSWVGLLLGVVLLLAPFGEGVVRIMSATYFRPLEQVTIVALTNIAFFAVAMSHVRGSLGVATGVSAALLIASLMLGEHAAIVPLTAAYSGVCVAWLARRHWRGLADAARAEKGLHIPLAPVLGLMVLLFGVTAASTRLAQGVPDIWGEWVPASGGSRWANPAALLGIGDGDWVVSGPNAKSTGAVDSEYFLESDLPTLFDVIMETYGEPRTVDELQRAIFVNQQQLLNEEGHKAPDAGEPGRQFSLYRKGPSQRNTPESNNAKALLYVEGAVPLHLAMTAYERFDGVNWHEPLEQQAVCRLDSRAPDVSWLWLPPQPDAHLFGGTRRHELRFGRLASDRLPLPNHLERFRLGQPDSTVRKWAVEVLTWAHDGILRARQTLPPGTYLEVSSHTVDRDKLLATQKVVSTGTSTDPCLEVPAHLRSSTETFVRRFVDLPRGWDQVDAVLNHLREHYAHDRDATIPPTCNDPVHYFLNQARGGPAYQFATAATLAMRRLGYPTRVVSGFYASPEDYVARAGHTPVHADDAHFWIEVRTAQGQWITLDPTPGYETEWHRRTLVSWAQGVVATLAQRVLENPLKSTAGILLSIGLWWRRLWLHERLLTLWCLWWPARTPEQRLAGTLRLLDLRSRLGGRARPAASTPLAWYQRVDEPACRDFVHCLYRVLYGGAGTAGVDRACRAAVRAMPTSRLRRGLGQA